MTTKSGYQGLCVLEISLNVAGSDIASPKASRHPRCCMFGSTLVPRLVENLVPSCSDEPPMVMAFVAVMQGGNS